MRSLTDNAMNLPCGMDHRITLLADAARPQNAIVAQTYEGRFNKALRLKAFSLRTWNALKIVGKVKSLCLAIMPIAITTTGVLLVTTVNTTDAV